MSMQNYKPFSNAAILSVDNAVVNNNIGILNTSNGNIVSLQTNSSTSAYSFILPPNLGTSGQVLTSGGSGANLSWTTVSGGGGSGTVTSVGLSSSTSLLTISSSPVTTSGTIGIGATLSTSGSPTAFLTNVGPTIASGGLTISAGDLTLSAGNVTAGIFTSTVATGSAPFVVSSQTLVSNLNSNFLQGSTWASPATIGSGTPSNATFNGLAVTTSATTPIFTITNTNTSPGYVATILGPNITGGIALAFGKSTGGGSQCGELIYDTNSVSLGVQGAAAFITGTSGGVVTIRGTATATGSFTAASIQNTPIGSTTASTGTFTTLLSTGAARAALSTFPLSTNGTTITASIVGNIGQVTSTGVTSLVTDTAANLITKLGAFQNTIQTILYSTVATTITYTAGTGVTLYGNTTSNTNSVTIMIITVTGASTVDVIIK